MAGNFLDRSHKLLGDAIGRCQELSHVDWLAKVLLQRRPKSPPFLPVADMVMSSMMIKMCDSVERCDYSRGQETSICVDIGSILSVFHQCEMIGSIGKVLFAKVIPHRGDIIGIEQGHEVHARENLLPYNWPVLAVQVVADLVQLVQVK